MANLWNKPFLQGCIKPARNHLPAQRLAWHYTHSRRSDLSPLKLLGGREPIYQQHKSLPSTRSTSRNKRDKKSVAYSRLLCIEWDIYIQDSVCTYLSQCWSVYPRPGKCEPLIYFIFRTVTTREMFTNFILMATIFSLFRHLEYRTNNKTWWSWNWNVLWVSLHKSWWCFPVFKFLKCNKQTRVFRWAAILCKWSSSQHTVGIVVSW